VHEFGAEKPISWAKPAHFDFFTINFTLYCQYRAPVEMLLFSLSLSPICLAAYKHDSAFPHSAGYLTRIT
jgi:hypothetical protein